MIESIREWFRARQRRAEDRRLNAHPRFTAWSDPPARDGKRFRRAVRREVYEAERVAEAKVLRAALARSYHEAALGERHATYTARLAARREKDRASFYARCAS